MKDIAEVDGSSLPMNIPRASDGGDLTEDSDTLVLLPSRYKNRYLHHLCLEAHPWQELSAGLATFISVIDKDVPYVRVSSRINIRAVKVNGLHDVQVDVYRFPHASLYGQRELFLKRKCQPPALQSFDLIPPSLLPFARCNSLFNDVLQAN